MICALTLHSRGDSNFQMTKVICDTCEWFVEGFRDHEGVLKAMPRRNDRPARGRCHLRSTPDIFPTRWSDERCGEHQPKETKAPEAP